MSEDFSKAMGNDIRVLTFIGNDMLRQTKNNLQFVKNCDGQAAAKVLTQTPKKGESFDIRKSTRYVGRRGEVFQAEDYRERMVRFTAGETLGVDLEFTNRELMFNLQHISEYVVKPAAETLSSLLDTEYLKIAIDATPNQVGTPGTIPTSLKLYNQARAKMSWESCPNTGQTMLITPDMQVEAVDAGKSFFGNHADDHYETGLLGKHSGAKVYEVQNLPAHVNGQRGGTPAVNGTTLEGATSLVLDGFTASAANRVKKGDVFTVAGSKAVNPWTRQSTGALRKFTATADADSDGSGNVTVYFEPKMEASGPFKNIDALPLNDALVVFDGDASAEYSVGLRYHRDAFLFGTFDQPQPEGAVQFCKMFSDPATGIKIRYMRGWDIRENKQVDRFDVVPGFGVAFREFAVRIASGAAA